MEFQLTKSIEILERTPSVLYALLDDISSEWTAHNEGGESWSVFDVVGHLVHGEQMDWMTRTEIILSDSNEREFEPFDRFAQFESSKGKTLKQILDAFTQLRSTNISKLRELNIQDKDLIRTGIHPTFGQVTLSQLLSAWVVHDLNHISQIVRVMAKQYKAQTGPWIQFLKILHQ
jgi:uncharacterized damage-inducible protein DinB